MQFRIIWNFGPKLVTQPNSETGLTAYIMIALDFLYHNLRILPNVIPFKYRKKEKVNFLIPNFLRTDGHVRSYDGDSDSPWRVAIHKFFLLGLPWLKYLFGAKKKNTIFDPIKWHFFPGS